MSNVKIASDRQNESNYLLAPKHRLARSRGPQPRSLTALISKSTTPETVVIISTLRDFDKFQIEKIVFGKCGHRISPIFGFSISLRICTLEFRLDRGQGDAVLGEKFRVRIM